MIKIENIEVFNWEGAIRGMRNPLNSWDKSDSHGCYMKCGTPCEHPLSYCVGQNDLSLMRKLRRAGSDHRKFLRQIMVSMDITAPLYWYKEFDTYKVGTTANSCSTMHKIHAKEFTLDDFSHEHLIDDRDCDDDIFSFVDDDGFIAYKSSEKLLKDTILVLNFYREKFLECTVSKYATAEECTKNKKAYWWQMIQLLPSSYNQRRTVTLNYEVLLNMYHARKAHKLNEWRELCKVIESMPYFREICLEGNDDGE